MIHIALILMLIFGSAQAQYVNIRLEIPAGINFNSEVTETMKGGTWENSKAKVWVGMETRENLTILLNLEFPEREITPPLEAYFLNDGSADFENALDLKAGLQELKMNRQPVLVRNINPRPPYLKAWLGLPVINGVMIKIEYP